MKNSFGMKWGDNGYAKILVRQKTPLGTSDKSACGLLKEIYFPYG